MPQNSLFGRWMSLVLCLALSAMAVPAAAQAPRRKPAASKPAAPKAPARSSPATAAPKTAAGVEKPAADAPAPPKPEKITSIEGITEYRYDNGVQLLLFPDPSKPTVTVNLTVYVGSRHEGYGETGMAHLLEHMLFKGTPHHSEIPKLLKERGARFNGTTWLDRTNYFETLLAEKDNLEFAVALEADRLVNSFVKHEDLLSEMTVVRNEFERGENDPARILNQRVMATAYEWHNYGKSTIGNRADIERVPIRNLQAFYRKYYQPDNVMLIVAGKFHEAHALELVGKYFGTLPKPQRRLDQTYTEEPPQDGERNVTLRRVGQISLVQAAYHVPAGGHPDIAPLDILSNILGHTPSGRLYKELVETKKATSVFAGVGGFHDPGMFEVEAELRREDSLDAARDALLEVTESVGSRGVSQEEVDRARQQLLKDREQTAADTSKLAVELSNWAAQGDWRLYFLHRDRLEQVTPDDVKRVAATYLTRNNRTLGVFIPTSQPDKTTIPETPDLDKLLADYKGRETIAAGESFDVSPENIERHVQRSTLAGGIKLALLPKKTRGEMVHLSLTIRYGNLENLKGLVTAAELLPDLMTRGTRHLSRKEIQDELDKQHASLEASGRTGSATFNIQTKRANLPAVLRLLRQVLREPALAAEEFEVLRREQLAGMEEQLTDPQALAIVEVRRMVSPYDAADVRYAPTVPEDVERLKALTLDDLRRLYRDYLGRQAGEIAVVGDFDPEQCTALLEETFADWTGQQTYVHIPLLVFPEVQAGRRQIETPDKKNAVYVAGEAFGIQDTDPDYPALVLGNYVLGGGALSSRLGDRVRQKEGLSYGVGSMLRVESLDRRGSVTIYAIYNPANRAKVEDVIREEIEKILRGGITSDELSQAQNGYLQSQQVSRSNDDRLTGILAGTLHAERTMAYYTDLEQGIQAATTSDVLTALEKYIDLKRLSVVVAGDFAAAEKEAAADAEEKDAESGAK